MMNISSELGRIGEEVVKDWFKRKGYSFMPASSISLELESQVRSVPTYVNNQFVGLRSVEFSNKMLVEKTKKFFTREELKRLKVFLNDFYKLKLESDEELRGLDLNRSNSYPDFIARIPELTFIEVKVNQATQTPTESVS